METIATNVILLVQLVRNGIKISVVRHGTMECVIKDTYLRSTRHQSIYGTDTFEVTCVMNRSEVAKFLNSVLYTLVYDNTLFELVTTLYDTVSNSIDFLQVLDGTNLWIEQALEYKIDALFMIGHVVHNLLFLAVWQCHLDECVVETDTLYTTLSQN